MDVALHKADRETQKVIPAEPICGTSFGHAKRSQKEIHHYRNCLGRGPKSDPRKGPTK